MGGTESAGDTLSVGGLVRSIVASGCATITGFDVMTTGVPHAETVAVAKSATVSRRVSLTRFRGRLTRSKFGAEVAHDIEEEGRASRAA